MIKRVITLPQGPAMLSSIAYDRLRREIIQAVLLPGQRLHIGQLCARYAMGASPIREALNRLTSNGLVNQSDQRGFHVRPLSEEHLIELTKTRGWLNEIALRESIAHGDSAWEERVLIAYHRLSKAPRTTASSGGTGSDRAWEDAHCEFHTSLIAACGSSWLVRYCGELFDDAERYRYLSRIANKRNEFRKKDEHREIMEAAVARDADTAVQQLHLHFKRTSELVQRSFRKLSETNVIVQKRSASGSRG